MTQFEIISTADYRKLTKMTAVAIYSHMILNKYEHINRITFEIATAMSDSFSSR